MNKIIGFEKDKNFELASVNVKCQMGDANEFATELQSQIVKVNKYHDRPLDLFRDDLKKSNISGENGVLYCKQTNILIGRAEVVPNENSYVVHQGLGRGTKGMLEMPYVNNNAPLLPVPDLYNPGMVMNY